MYDTNNELDGIGMPTSLDQKRALLERYKKMKMEADAALVNNPAPTPEEMQAVDQGQQDLNNRGADYALIQGLSNAANKIGNYQGVAQKSDLGALDKMQEADRRQAHMDALNIDKRQAMFQNLQNKGQQAAQNEIGIQSDVEQQDDLNSPIDAETMQMMQEALSASGSKIKLPPNLTKGQFKANPWMSKLLERAAPADGKFANRPIKVLDPVTGQATWKQKQPDGSMIDLGMADFAPEEKVNRVTGAKVNQRQEILKGTTPLEGEKSYVTGMQGELGKTKGKDINASDEAGIKLDAFDGKANEIRDLFKKSFTGPLAGRAPAGMLHEGTAKLESILNRDAALQIKDISGAAVSEQEAQRLAKFLPKITDTKTQLEGKLSAMKRELGIIAKERKQKAGSSPVEQSGKPAQRKVWTP